LPNESESHPGRKNCGSQGHPGNEQRPGRLGRRGNCETEIAEALNGKRIMLLPVSKGGMNLKTTDINRLIETLGIKALSGGK